MDLWQEGFAHPEHSLHVGVKALVPVGLAAFKNCALMHKSGEKKRRLTLLKLFVGRKSLFSL